MVTHMLDGVPLWGLFLSTLAIVLFAVEVGFWLGHFRRRQLNPEKPAPVEVIVAATLGLLAFMLAFTFSLAASRFDNRRQLVLKESNAIGTCWLRAGLLPAPHGDTARRLLREYVGVRLDAFGSGNLEQAFAKTDVLHQALWAQATETASKDTHSVVTGLFIQSLNDVIDVHSERVLIAVRSRIPVAVWLGLYFVTILAMAALGYHESVADSRRSFAVLALVLAFSAVILLIADLDRPREGMLQVSQQAMVDLRDFIDRPEIGDKSAKP